MVKAAVQFVDKKFGWHRVGFCVSLAVITFAVVVLYRMLRGLDVRTVHAALREIPLSRIALAALFVALSYVTLTFYDWFALRTHRSPRRALPRSSSRRVHKLSIRSATISARAHFPGVPCATESTPLGT